jgi:hypothetical protein
MIRFWDFKLSGAPPLLSESFGGAAIATETRSEALVRRGAIILTRTTR